MSCKSRIVEWKEILVNANSPLSVITSAFVA
jgi:hypothetical protein